MSCCTIAPNGLTSSSISAKSHWRLTFAIVLVAAFPPPVRRANRGARIHAIRQDLALGPNSVGDAELDGQRPVAEPAAE